jgi:peptidyl-dipeptidase Dcp
VTGFRPAHSRNREADLANTDPFAQDSTRPFGLPPFDEIRPEHYRPAFERGLKAHLAEIDAIANNPEPPTFRNTIEALERAGRDLRRVGRVFWNLAGSNTSPDLQAIEREMSPVLARHYSSISMNPALFARVDKLWTERAEQHLDDEQMRVLELTHRGFVRSGAKLGEEDKKRLAAIVERLASLGTTFSQNVLADESGWTLPLASDDDMAGMSEAMRADAARAAADRGTDGGHLVTLSRSSVEPFLQFSARRDLRKTAFEAWTKRGENGGTTDNRAIIAETVRLRAERARLLGFETFAHFKLDDTMAKTPENVRQLLESVWTPARARAARERDALQDVARGEGSNAEIEAHDWRFYSEKLRKVQYDIDDAELKPYLSLDGMIEAAFYTAGRLFDLEFVENKSLALYHPDARAFEVRDRSGKHVALFIGDYYARPSKRSGAWMSNFREQHGLDGEVRPIIVNVMNFAKPAEGRPALLSLDDARTLFHEFGHALHGMLSDVTYPRISGTSVSRDFVELPSQLFEHWLMQPQVLRKFARHTETGAPIPDDLIARVQAARAFNQGFATVEYTSSAIVDLAFHLLGPDAQIDVTDFERQTLERIGMPKEIVMRHRSPHFTHVFSGDGYSAGYYSYLWSEVLDADAFEAFEETGDCFNPEVARRLKEHIYSSGGRHEPEEAYRAFRGRLPSTEPLLRKRGLLNAN